MSFVSRVLFPAPPTSYTADSFPGELLLVPRSLNPQTSVEDFIPLLFLRSHRARFLILVLHGNSEDLGTCRQFCQGLRKELNVHVLAPEYPGYGVCPGPHCDESEANECAEGAFRFAREVLRWPPSQIIVLGRSVGTGMAVSLAQGQPHLAGLVLISPFLSVKEACREVFGPAANLLQERFPNHERIPHVRAPCLVVHGLRDATIPARHGQLLFEACRSQKRLVQPPDLDHNANLLLNREHILNPLREFFELPQFCQKEEELHVPVWAFSWRPSRSYLSNLLPASKAAVLLGQTTGKSDRCRCFSCAPGCMILPGSGPCGPCTCNALHTAAPMPKRLALQPDMASNNEATIAEAVEYILAADAEVEWVQQPTPRGSSAGDSSPQVLSASASRPPSVDTDEFTEQQLSIGEERGCEPSRDPTPCRSRGAKSPTFAADAEVADELREWCMDPPKQSQCQPASMPHVSLPIVVVQQRPDFSRNGGS